ncbi:hypothetical protein MMC09_001407 [Bachmanniomyces sp. S44760]|nr:hypothetical protein [Bachmanniomyces sp. S44760]
MAGTLARYFEKGCFVIVPIQTKADKPQRLRFIVLKKDLLEHPIDEGNSTFAQLHGTELEFKNDNRPALHYLYIHYVISILRARKWTSLEEIKQRLQTDGAIWATSGPYFRRSMLRKLGRAIGDCEVEEGMVQGIGGSVSEAREEVIAADLAERFEVLDDRGYDDDSESEIESEGDEDD